LEIKLEQILLEKKQNILYVYHYYSKVWDH